MRQAGRYQPQYRAIRQRLSLLEICERPDVAAEVTLLPVQELNVDAAILFSDIVVPLRAVGIDLEIREHVGPVIAQPIREARDIERLRPLVPEEDEPFVSAAVRLIAQELGDTPLIGFSGGPFTLASYLVEGGPTRDYLRIKGLMWQDPGMFRALLERLRVIAVEHLRAQVAAGAAAVQVFDSWIGSLAPADFEMHVLPVVQELMRDLADLGVPRIYFGVQTAGLLSLLREVGADVIGVDWRVDIARAGEILGPDLGLQGNLDPALLVGAEGSWRHGARGILRAMAGRPGHVFNLGHGVLPGTDQGALRDLVDFVHSFRD